MDTRLDHEIEANVEESIEPAGPEWLETGFEKISPPPSENINSQFFVRSLWTAYQSVPPVLVRLPLGLVHAIYFRAVEAFYWKTALLQACALIIFFADILTPGMLLILGTTYAVLLARDGYYDPEDMLEWNIFLLALAPELILAQGFLLGWVIPALGTFFGSWLPPLRVVASWLVSLDIPPIGEIWLRSLAMGILSAVCKGFYSRAGANKADTGHLYKEVMDAHTAAWRLACCWIAAWGICLWTDDHITTPQLFLIGLPSAFATLSFVTSIRMQLNPMAGTWRHTEIDTTINTDHIERELVTKRDYLLVGSNWRSLKGLLEIGAFVIATFPVPIALLFRHAGSAIGIDWLELDVHVIGYVGLTATWFYVRHVHQRTYKLFDAAIARHRMRKSLGLPIEG